MQGKAEWRECGRPEMTARRQRATSGLRGLGIQWWTVTSRCRVRLKPESPAQFRLDPIVAPQEQVTALEAPDRVKFLEGQDRGLRDPRKPDLQVDLESGDEFAGAQRVVGGDCVGVGHGRLLNAGRRRGRL